MKITALRLFNVKRFANRGVAIEGIGDGVNVLCAPNEFGKSTSFEALHALFFQSHMSTASEVRAIRPYSGGNPVVEADIETTSGKYRIAKQFYGGRSAQIFDLKDGRLTAQADEAENFISSLVQGGTKGPAGLLWVRQGITGIDKRSRAEEDSEKQVRVDLLESVQGEVEAVTGGRRMADVMASTAQELSVLVTATGRAKAGGRYATAIDERDRLLAEEQKLAAEVRVLRDALDRRTAVTRRLSELELDEDRAARREAIEQAEAALEAVKAQADRINQAEVRLELARERHMALFDEERRFVEALDQAQSLRERAAAADKRKLENEKLRETIAGETEAIRQKQMSAEADEVSARTVLDNHQAAVRAAEAAAQIGELKDRLAQAEQARQMLEEAEAALVHAQIPEGAVDELMGLDVQLASERARREVGLPTVTIHYDPDTASKISLGDRALADGETHGYDGNATLRAPGIGTVELRANLSSIDDSKLGELELRRSTLLASMGVADLSGAQMQQVQAQQIDIQIRKAKTQLDLLAPNGIAKLREAIADCAVIDSDAVQIEGSVDEVHTMLDNATLLRKQAGQELQAIDARRSAADNDFAMISAEQATIDAEAKGLMAILGPEADRQARQLEISNRMEPLAADLTAVETEVEELRAKGGDVASAQAAVARLRSVEKGIDDEIAQLREQRAELNGTIRTRSDEAVEETWQEAEERLAAAENRVAAFANEVKILQRLMDALETARTDARDLYLQPVMAELKPLLGLLFDDAAITFDEKTLLPQTIVRGGVEEEIDRLSGGMREQLSVLTRLAFARLLASDGRPAPVILDDALVYSDDDRIEKMFDALHRQAQAQQIIVFSCRQRAFQRLGGNLLQLVDWNP